MPRTVLICHSAATLNRYGLPLWLNSFSDLAAVVLIDETRKRKWQRIKYQFKRDGLFKLFDVMLMKAYYVATSMKNADHAKESRLLERLQSTYPCTSDIKEFRTTNPNNKATRAFIAGLDADLAVVRCKLLLRESLFNIPKYGSYVMHPGICPQYRNSHGCFWALANRDLENVGCTLLRIDKGIDTGPIYGFYGCEFDEATDTHIEIQMRSVFDNLDPIQEKLIEIASGNAKPIDISDRPSAVWGQPGLTDFLGWKRQAKRQSK
jgi:hypothetical protein